MFDYYGSGLVDGMLIQAAEKDTDTEKEKEMAAVRAMKLCLHLIEIGQQNIIKHCLEHPEDIQFYYDIYRMDIE